MRQKKKVLLVSLGLVLLAGVTGFTYWLRRPAAVYKRYEEVAENLGLKVEVAPAELTPTPASSAFSLLIPKLNINVPVIANVDGSNPNEYLWRITQGVAHFRHSKYANITVDGALPGEGGNIFLFGHSQIPGGDTSSFKGVFNDLHKLVPGDEMTLVYQGNCYRYRVTEGKVVSKKSLENLSPTEEETLTLMTCWPLGLDIQRYIVRGVRF